MGDLIPFPVKPGHRPLTEEECDRYFDMLAHGLTREAALAVLEQTPGVGAEHSERSGGDA